MKKVLGLILILVTGKPVFADSQEEIFGSAAVRYRWLNIPSSARTAGLAGAYVARGAEPGALDGNPASLAGIDGQQGIFTHNSWVQGMRLERVIGAWHTDCLGSFAASVGYLSLGEIEHLKLNGSGQPETVGTYSPSAYALAGSWGGNFGPLSLGATLRGVRETLGESTAMGLQADLGMRWKWMNGLRFGAGIRSIPLDASDAITPTSVRTGMGYTWGQIRPLALDLNVDYQIHDQEPPSLRGGAEWATARNFILRLGYTLGNSRTPTGVSAGVGWLAGFAEFDYALYGAGDLGISHLVTLRLHSAKKFRTAAGVVIGDPADIWDCPEVAKETSLEDKIDVIKNLGFEVAWESPNVLLITLGDERAHFDPDQDTLKEEDRARIQALTEVMKDFPEATIRVDGHTDNQASHSHNMDLSMRRARRVQEFMVTYGVDPDTFTDIRAWAYDKPLASNLTEEGRAKNRRVELRVTIKNPIEKKL